jgi:acetolactate synthase I/II/III large subunit
MAQQRVADYIFSVLADVGIHQVFLLPGGGAMHLNDGLVCEKRLEPIPCHHEQACGISAEANGRTNAVGFGVALVTTGPGATNVLTPVAGAWIESLPLLIISGQVKRKDRLNGRPLRQSGVQEVDVVTMVKPVSKYAATIVDPTKIRFHLEYALWAMRGGRPGPVWLDIPLDVQAALINSDELLGFTPPTVNSSILTTQIANLQQLLKTAERPLFILGHGTRIAGAADLFRNIAEKLNIPCVFTWNAADLLPWEHPLYVGRPGVVAARAPNFAIQNCDLLISVGCRLDNIITAYNPQGFASHAKKVVVDVDINELNRHEMPIDLAIEADAKDFFLAWLDSDLTLFADDAWHRQCQDWKHRYPALDGREFAGDTISHYQFVDALSDAIPENRLVISGSSGLAVEVFYTVFRNKVGQRMFLTSGLGSMGYGLPAVIGACLGAERQQTVGVESDGSLMLNLQELVTLKALSLPITLIVMNNGGYASIRNTQRNYFDSRYIATGPKTGLLFPDLVKLCESIGLPAMRIESAQDLASGLDYAMTQSGTFICEVCLQTNEVLSPKVAALPQTDGSMLSMPLEDMSPLLPLAVLEQEMRFPLIPVSVKAKRKCS